MSSKRLGIAALALAACSQGPPTGQVLARVDDIEITRRDVLIELVASGAPADADALKMQPELLDQIITRKLLAAEARRRSIDRSPEFLGVERRNRELLLGELLMQRVSGRLPPPSPELISRFVEANRARFDQRRRLRIDRIETSAQNARVLRNLSSLDAISEQLQKNDRAFGRTVVEVDSLTLPPDRAAALASKRDRPVLSTSGDRLWAEHTLAATPAPVDPDGRRRIAAATLSAAAARTAVERDIRRLRASARVEYQERSVADRRAGAGVAAQ